MLSLVEVIQLSRNPETLPSGEDLVQQDTATAHAI